ncbi:DUF6197 family protein [Streptomyces sp. G45]|uniref:DUF6197 family protein n=1 Tax=Streptomyces sp. G45 TaxID=3406627 RepID=UPI003C1E3039
MTATLIEIETSSRLLATEVEEWLKSITEAAPAADPSPASTDTSPFDIKALAAAGLAEIERTDRASQTARTLARPSLLERLARTHRRPAARASLHIRRAAAVMATAGWSRTHLTDAAGRHCILGALQAVDADADTVLRSHTHIRAAMTTGLPTRSDDWEQDLATRCRRAGADVSTVRRQIDIATHNDLFAASLGAVLELMETAAALAEKAGD